MSGYVYFIRPVGQPGPVKIGCSIMPQARLEAYMTWAPHPLEIVAKVPGTCDLERVIHRCFADQHSHREWFYPSKRLTKLIADLRAGIPIEQALDLKDQRGVVRKSISNFAETDPGKIHRKYYSAFSALKRRLGASLIVVLLPDDVEGIMTRWRRIGDGAKGQHPTPAEFARLDEVLGNPEAHIERIPFEEWLKRRAIAEAAPAPKAERVA